MDFVDTPAEAAFRAEVRAWLGEHLEGRVRRARAGNGPSDETRLGHPRRVGEAARRRPLGRSDLAGRVRRPRREHRPSRSSSTRSTRRADAPTRIVVLRRGALRPDADPVRHRRAEAALPAEDPARRRDVVPGILRAQRRQRPREHPDPRRARRRRVGHHRPEGVDDARAPRRLVLRRVPHRSRVDVASRPVVPVVPDGPARHRGAAAAPDDRQLGVQRGLLRRRAHREGERARPGRRGLEGRDGDARLRAGHRLHVVAARVRGRVRGAARDRAQERRRRASRHCATSWPTALRRACRS